MVFKISYSMRLKENNKNMNENTKSYMVKDIPVDHWREFKIKLLQDGYDTYNEALLNLIEKYSKGK